MKANNMTAKTIGAVSHQNDPVDPQQFRRVLGAVPTSVTAVTTTYEEAPAGMVVGTFTSVSLDPSLVSFLADVGSTTLPKILESGTFCANIFSSQQETLCRFMAGRRPDRFEGVEWHTSELGNPMLEDVVAWVDCEVESEITIGDHILVVGRVQQLDTDPTKNALLFFRSKFGEYISPNDMLLDRLALA